VRVIAGSAKGRRLGPVPRGVRPVSDRVREGLFSSLGEAVDGAKVLDLFAGSGALGIEALSRGAAHATFVEADRSAAAAIAANLRTTGFAERATVVREDALRFLMRDGDPARRWDLVLADPPYEHPKPEVEEVLRGLAERHLAQGWTCVLTRATRDPILVIPVHWRVYRRLEYGDSTVLIAGQEPVEA
jgi:16S rRNA (guanine966-N2)-methyltransferase